MPSPFTRASVYFLRIIVFPNLHRHLNFVVEVLMVLSTSRLGHSEALGAVNLRRFLALRLLRAMCKQKQFVKFEFSFTTLYATIAWLENGVI